MNTRLRMGLISTLLAAACLAVGGAVAWAAGSDDSPPDDQAASDDRGDGTHDHDEDAHAHAEAVAAGVAGRGRGHSHRHEPLPPYDDRVGQATPEEQAAADALVADVRATLAAYADPDDALAAGFQTPRDTTGRFPIHHYRDPTVAEEGTVLDPERPNGLVYYEPEGSDPVLLGAYFVAPPDTPAPTPAGDLAVWHSHNPRCPDFFATEDEPCADVRRMLHVWTVDTLDVTSPRTGEPVAIEVTDPFGAPFLASVARAG
jgi:hypothetical protein